MVVNPNDQHTTKKSKNDLILVLSALLGMNSDHLTTRVLDSSMKHIRKAPTGTWRLAKVCGHDLRLVPGGRVFVGGGGVVVQTEECDVPGVQYALKIARPSLFEGQSPEVIEAEARKAEAEYQRHLPLAHPNIAKLYGADRLAVKRSAVNTLMLPCWLVEWVDGAAPLGRYVSGGGVSPTQAVGLLRQSADALDHLHTAGFVHWDVKSDNIMVSATGQVKLMDLGNARVLNAEPYAAAAMAESTQRNLPPVLDARVESQIVAGEAISNNRVPVSLAPGEPSWDMPWLDLHMLAREFQRIALPEHDPDGEFADHTNGLRNVSQFDEDEQYASQFLLRLLDRLTTGGEPSGPMFYTEARAVSDVLGRLIPALGAADNTRELSSDPQHVLRLPPNLNVPWTTRVDALFNSTPMLRLKGHRQLATVCQVYPGAEHTRWEHSAGALAHVAQYVRALMADRGSPLFRLNASELDIDALLFAAAVHDLGHPAYGHQLEETLVVADEFAHEKHSLAVLRAYLGQTEGPALVAEDAAAIRQVVDRYWRPRGGGRELVARAIEILEATPGTDLKDRVSDEASAHLQVLHAIISGPLDADKADYLVRDGHHCGVAYPSGIDFLRLLQSMTTFKTELDGRVYAGLAVSDKGVLPVESMLVARYQMFRAVYWQRTVRAMTAMLEEALEIRVLGSQQLRPTVSSTDVEALVSRFRVLNDSDALTWLGEGSRDRERIASLTAGVRGDRQRIYWCAAELYGGADFAHDDVEIRNDELYRELVTRQEALVDLARKDSTAAVRARREDRARLASAIAERLGMSASKLTWRDILLDFPSASRDQVRDLYVISPAPNGEEAIVVVEQLTPIAAAVKEAFLRSVRRARVFIRPEVAGGMWSMNSEHAVAHAVEAALDEVFLRQMRMEFSR